MLKLEYIRLALVLVEYSSSGESTKASTRAGESIEALGGRGPGTRRYV